LPGVEEGGAYGARALRLRGKLLACEPTNPSAEPGSLVVKLDDEDRDALLTEAPETYYLPDHYKNFNSVLVRLSRIDADALRDLLGVAYKFVTRKATRKAPPKRRRSR
jgi:hypothetical protein